MGKFPSGACLACWVFGSYFLVGNSGCCSGCSSDCCCFVRTGCHFLADHSCSDVAVG